MVIVEGWVRMAPEVLAEFEPAAVKMITASRAEEGCIDYAYARDLLDPAVLRIAEKWRDQAALDFHFATPHMAEFLAALGHAERQGGDVRVYESSETRRMI